MKLADSISEDIFGKITPPPGTPKGNTPLTSFLAFGIQFFFVAAGLTTLVYLLWGTFDWITSNGEKEKLGKAQSKIQNAIIGLLLVFVMLAIVVLFEKVIFHGNLCFGISCPIKLKGINNEDITF